MIRTFCLGLIFFLSLVSIASAQGNRKQTETRLRQFFEGKKVVLKIEMPAARDGANVNPEKIPSLDRSRYARTISNFGVSILRGDTATITEIEVSDDEIEFQLDGGGYGSPNDFRTQPGEPPPPIQRQPTVRELELEEQLKIEVNSSRIDFLRVELARERARRELEDRQDRERYERALEERETKIRERRIRRGSRFTLTFTTIKTASVTPEMLINYLAEYVDFSPMSGNKPSNLSMIAPLKTDDRPYRGDWRNVRAEKLAITDDALQFGEKLKFSYREIFRLTDSRTYVLAYETDDGAERFLLVVAGDNNIKLRFYLSLDDLQSGQNVRGEEIWER